MFDFLGYKYINEAKEIIKNKSNPNWEKDVRIAMSKVYRYYKKKLPYFRENIKSIVKVFELENLLRNEFLPIDSRPAMYSDFVLPEEVHTEEEAINMVMAMVFNERVRLTIACDGSLDFMKNPLSQECIVSSAKVFENCKKENVSCKRYCCSTNLSEGRFHSFCIVDFSLDNGEVKKYLIDCTYRQFFTYRNSFLERIGLVGFGGCCMGTYMLMNESRKATASHLLKYGFIEMTPENIKNYFDGFIFEGRNGGFYAEKNKEFLDEDDYNVEYSYTDYLDAIDGKITLPNDWMDMLYTRISNPDIVFDYNLYSMSDNKKHSNYNIK